jgi:hypothetical protein
MIHVGDLGTRVTQVCTDVGDLSSGAIALAILRPDGTRLEVAGAVGTAPNIASATTSGVTSAWTVEGVYRLQFSILDGDLVLPEQKLYVRHRI